MSLRGIIYLYAPWAIGRLNTGIRPILSGMDVAERIMVIRSADTHIRTICSLYPIVDIYTHGQSDLMAAMSERLP